MVPVFEHCKWRARAAAQGHDRFGVEIGNHLEAMKRKFHHRQGYAHRRSVHFVAKTRGSEIHLGR